MDRALVRAAPPPNAPPRAVIPNAREESASLSGLIFLSLVTRHFPSLLSRFTRKCTCQRKRGYVACGAVRFLGIVSEVFLDDANDLNRGHSTGHAGQPVPSRDTEQLIMHQEAIGEAFHPAQTGCITVDAGGVSVPFAVYA